jgi:hypothetical protein
LFVGVENHDVEAVELHRTGQVHGNGRFATAALWILDGDHEGIGGRAIRHRLHR